MAIETERPPSMYSTTKLAAEWLGRSFCAGTGIAFASVRLSGVFGPWGESVTAGPGLIVRRLVEGALAGQPVHLDEPELTRSMNYLYAPDAAEGAVRALEVEVLAHEVYTLAMARNYAAADIAHVLESYLQRPVTLVLPETTDSRPPAPVFNTARARHDLGWRPRYPMPRALADYLQRLTQSTAMRTRPPGLVLPSDD
jgi:UDP-glucose 4-epimerase